MQVETFVQSEDVTISDAEEATALIEELGLTGQQQVIHPSGERLPFAEMSIEEQAVYTTCFPQHLEVEAYNRCAIPVRVLECFRDHRKHFTHVEVWYPTSARDVDPLLVGVREHPERSWDKTYYLMARWGTALVDFEELATTATQMWCDDFKRQVEEAYATLKAGREALGSVSPQSMRSLMRRRASAPSAHGYVHGM